MRQRSRYGGLLVTSLAAALALVGASLALAAQGEPALGDSALGRRGLATTNPTQQVLPGPLPDVGFDQKLGAELPLDARFLDESGREVVLGDYFGERPVVVVPVYYDCPMLCSLVLNGLATTLSTLPFDAGNEFTVIAFSFDPSETPEMAAKGKQRTLEQYGRTDAAEGFHFLTGDAESVARLTDAIGFRYSYDEESGEFAHAAGLVVGTPSGVIARTYYGIEIPPRDLRLGLVEAADEKIGSLVDQVLLYCFRYDPSTGQYSAVAMRIIRLGGLVTVVALVFLVTVFLVKERASRRIKRDRPVEAA